ncbi:MAG: UDP-glucuronic acid decarboxylase family protein [Cyanobacteriota bacterium]|nr:UDP-glucuronic acid decarboxylase family protein [Cyanobacteriota bacterium]
MSTHPQPKTILVTGAAGFIGTHLVQRLVSAGERVIALDNCSTGRQTNLVSHRDQANFQFWQQDVTQPIATSPLATCTWLDHLDQIYHLACPASPVHYQKDPIQTIKTSVLGTLNMLELAQKTGSRLLFASTSEVYGDPTVHPQPEDYWGNVNPIGIRACYDEGKRVSETLMFDYHRQHQVDIAVARIFNTYGPTMNLEDGRVVSNFIVQALRGDDLTVYGDGSQTRSFCYVADLVEGLMRLMASSYTGPCNLGNPDEFTVNQLAALVQQLTGTTSQIIYHPLPSDDPKQRRPDISRAKAWLNWQPQIPLVKGLEMTIPDFAQRLGAGKPAEGSSVG